MLDTKDRIVKAITQVWDLKGLSKDLINALVDKAGKQKDILIDVLAKEFTAFLSKINITEEAQKILEGMTLEVTVKKKAQTKKATKKKRKRTKP